MLVWAPDGISEAADRILIDAGHYVVSDSACKSRPQAIWTRRLDCCSGGSGGCEMGVYLAGHECKLIACPATGTEHLDAARAAGKRVLSLRDCGDLSEIRATVEFTIGAILSLTRRIPSAVESVRAGEWDRMKWQGTDLAGKTAMVVGAHGRIGNGVASILGTGFHMGVMLNERDPPDMLLRGLAYADLVTVHCDLNPTSRGMFGPAEFAAMKRGAYFVNTARGAIVDEAALLAALESGHLAGAALDVFCTEPLPADSPLLAFAREQPHRLLLTPHLAGNSVESLERAEVLLAKRLSQELANAS